MAKVPWWRRRDYKVVKYTIDAPSWPYDIYVPKWRPIWALGMLWLRFRDTNGDVIHFHNASAANGFIAFEAGKSNYTWKED